MAGTGCFAGLPGPYSRSLSIVVQCAMSPPSLLDPVSCGEDVFANAARISELAPDHCVDCADNHIRSAVHRCTPVPKGVDRPEFINLIKGVLIEKAARPGDINIVIPGSADTNILATTAHAAAVLGREVLDRCRFTVIDLCATPLILCREFGTRHHLNVETVQSDLTANSLHFAADIIVVHSVLRFIPRGKQLAFLNMLGTWLNASGHVVISNRLRLDKAAEVDSELRKRNAANAAIGERLAEGTLLTREPPGILLERLQRAMHDCDGLPGEFASLEEVRQLIARSQLREISLEYLSWTIEITPGNTFERHRVHAVLSR